MRSAIAGLGILLYLARHNVWQELGRTASDRQQAPLESAGDNERALPSDDDVVPTPQPSPEHPPIDWARVVSAILGGAAGIGALATAVGFTVLTARLIAAELPVIQGLDLFGIRGAIATGLRALAFPLLVGAIAGPLLVAAAETGKRTRTDKRDGRDSVRSIKWTLAVVSGIPVAVVLLFGLVSAFDAFVPQIPWPLPQLVWIATVAMLFTVFHRYKRARGDSIAVRLALTVPFALTMFAIAPLPIGLAVAPFAAAVFWMLKPGKLADLERPNGRSGAHCRGLCGRRDSDVRRRTYRAESPSRLSTYKRHAGGRPDYRRRMDREGRRINHVGPMHGGSDYCL